MRVFYAIEFSNEIKNYLSALQDEVRKYSTAGNFTLKENFHLTLRFIGEQSESQVEKLKLTLREAAAQTKPFELNISKTGYFHKGSKKIVWAGLRESRELDGLYCCLESMLLKLGYTNEERGYNPHITLVREARIENIDEIQASLKFRDQSMKIRAISLMESKRINNKLCYVPVERADLNEIQVPE